MLYVIIGTDTQQGHVTFEALCASLTTTHPDMTVVHIDADTYTGGRVEGLIWERGLFGEKSLIVLDRILIRDDVRDTMMSLWGEIATSENIFIWREGTVDAATKKKMEHYAEKIVENNLPSIPYKHGASALGGSRITPTSALRTSFSTFDLADAVALRDKKRAWSLLARARMFDLAPEEVQGTLFWQVKMMILAKNIRSAEDAGMKPYVFTKAKRGADKFTQKELHTLSMLLVGGYHTAHRGGIPLFDAMEEIILGL